MFLTDEQNGTRIALFEPMHVSRIVRLRERNAERLSRFESVPAFDEAAMQAWVRAALHGFAEGRQIEGVIVHRDEIVGQVGLRINAYARTGNVTCWVDAGSEGRGAARTAARIITVEAFERGLHRVEYRIARGNERSVRAVESLGASLDGVMRGGHQSPHGPVDLLVYGVLGDELRP